MRWGRDSATCSQKTQALLLDPIWTRAAILGGVSPPEPLSLICITGVCKTLGKQEKAQGGGLTLGLSPRRTHTHTHTLSSLCQELFQTFHIQH